jgi:hypothetical protein
MLAVRSDLQVEFVDGDGDELVRATDSTGWGTVTFSTAAYPNARSDGERLYRGWAWRPDVTAAASGSLEPGRALAGPGVLAGYVALSGAVQCSADDYRL